MEILELRKNEFIPGAGVVPVYFVQDDFVSGNIGRAIRQLAVWEKAWVVKVDI